MQCDFFIAGVISSQFRNTDFVGRIGGDEFVVLMPDIPAKDANPNHVCPVIAICREGSLDQIQTAVSSEIIDDLLFSPLEVSVLKRRIKANIHPDKNNEADA